MKKAIFIQKNNNNRYVRYFCIGTHDNNNKFTGIVQGYEGGGECSERLVFKDKCIPDYKNGECIEWDTIVESYDSLSLLSFAELDDTIREYIEFDTELLIWRVNSEKIGIFKENVFSENMLNEPLSYALTTWESRSLEEWTYEEFIQILKTNSGDILHKYIKAYIEKHNALPLEFVANKEEDFEYTINQSEFESILNLKVLNDLKSKIKTVA